jgi:hypothetical protein
MRKAFIFFANQNGDLRAKSKAYLRAFKQQLFNTPERALDRAYSAALIIKFIEREYLQDKQTAISVNHNHNQATESSLEVSLKQLLGVIRLRLTEFKLSHLVLGYPGSSYAQKAKLIEQHVEKLKLIDEVLDRHLSKQSLFSPFSLFQKQKTHSNNSGDYPYLTTVDVQATEVVSNRR